MGFITFSFLHALCILHDFPVQQVFSSWHVFELCQLETCV